MRFPESSGASLEEHLADLAGPSRDADAIYCGVEPSALFESRDGGRDLEPERRALEPSAPREVDAGRRRALPPHGARGSERPGRMVVAISTGGAYRSDDGGRSWQVKNRGVRADFLPDPHPEFGQCVHKIAHDAADPDRLFLQNHWGLYRSDDGGDSWKDVANGRPFGLRILRGDPSARPRHGVHRCRCTPTASAARRTGSCASTGRKNGGQVLAGDDAGASAEGRLRNRRARRDGGRRARPGRRVLRDAQRQALRLARRGPQLAADCARACRRSSASRRRVAATPREGAARRSAPSPRSAGPPDGGAIPHPGPLQPFFGGRGASRRDPRRPRPSATPSERLGRIHPGVRDRVLTEQGELRPHVNVFVGRREHPRLLEGLATTLPEECEISILPAVSGG